MGSGVDKKGNEIVSPVPMELPLGFEYPESLESLMRKVMPDVSRMADKMGYDTYEEANDFDVGDPDDIDPYAPWEYPIDQELEDKEQRLKAIQAREQEQKELEEFKAWKKKPAPAGAEPPGGGK